MEHADFRMNPQSKGGIIKYAARGYTFEDGHEFIQPEFLKRKRRGCHQSLMSLAKIAEVRLLIEQEMECKNKSNAHLACLLREEELNWYKRSNAQFILEGDSNIRYFQNVVNG
jgi:hypothetical protein